MKVRLLKKIRKQYSIVYYPDGMIIEGKYLHHVRKYVVHRKWKNVWGLVGCETKEQAIKLILIEVREKYAKYSRKYKKPNYRGVKVWHTN